MGVKPCQRGVKLTKKCPRGQNRREKLSEGGKLDKTVWGGHKKKTSPRGLKNPVLCLRVVRKIPVFGQGVEKIPILSEGVTKIFLPPPVFLME